MVVGGNREDRRRGRRFPGSLVRKERIEDTTIMVVMVNVVMVLALVLVLVVVVGREVTER